MSTPADRLRASLERRRAAKASAAPTAPLDASREDVLRDKLERRVGEAKIRTHWEMMQAMPADPIAATTVRPDVTAADVPGAPKPSGDLPLGLAAPANRGVVQAAEANARAMTGPMAKARALLPGASPASFVERTVGRLLSHLPEGNVSRFGEELASTGEYHGEQEAAAHARLPFLATLPADMANLYLEIEAGARIPGPIGRAIGAGAEEVAPGARAIFDESGRIAGTITRKGVGSTVSRVASTAGREAERFGTLEATKGVVEQDSPEDIAQRTALGAASGLGFGAGTQLFREALGRGVAAMLQRRAIADEPFVGPRRPEVAAAPQAPPVDVEAQTVHTTPAPAPAQGPKPRATPAGAVVLSDEGGFERELETYTDAQLKRVRASVLRMRTSATAAAVERTVDAIDKHLQARNVAGAAPLRPTVTGEAQKPGEALHDTEGRPVPGTEVAPDRRDRRVSGKRGTSDLEQFQDLPHGTVFRFAGDPARYTKDTEGFYRPVTGGSRLTGNAESSVVRIEEAPAPKVTETVSPDIEARRRAEAQPRERAPEILEGYRGVPAGKDPLEPGVAGSIFVGLHQKTAEAYGPEVHKVRVTLRNPLKVRNMDELWRAAHPGGEQYPHHFNAADIQEVAIPKLRAMGYDGAMIDNEGDGGPEVVAFDKASVKPVNTIREMRIPVLGKRSEVMERDVSVPEPRKPPTPQVPNAPGQKHVLPSFATGHQTAAEPERIHAVAIREASGNVVAGKPGQIHGELASQGDHTPDGEEGFVTTTGRFVSRREAARIAKNADQLTKPGAAALAARKDEGLDAIDMEEPHTPESARAANVDRFIQAWEPIFRAAATENPADYGTPTDAQMDRTVRRIRQTLIDKGTGGVSHSETMKAAQRKLGLPPTQRALEEFISRKPAVQAAATSEPVKPTDEGRTVQNTLEEANKPASPEDLTRLVDAAVRLLKYERQGEPGAFPRDSKAVRVWAEKVLGRPYTSGTWTTDDAYDAIEIAANQYAHEQLGGMDWDGPAAITGRLERAKQIEEHIFGTRTRTEAMVARQQFSTPIPIAEAAQYALDVQPGEKVLEPTAGTGNLINSLRDTGVQITANELDPRRRTLLAQLDKAITITGEDALRLQLSGKRYNAIVMNPPFGGYNLKGKYGGQGATEFQSSDVSQRFVAAALKSLADNGRLVAIMPEGMMGKTASPFRAWLRANYEVVAFIEAPEGSYATRGTKFGTWMLVVDNTGPHAGTTLEVRKPSWGQWYDTVAMLGRPERRARPSSAHEPAQDVAAARGVSTAPAKPLASTPLPTASSPVAEAAQQMAAAVKQAVKEAVEEVRNERAESTPPSPPNRAPARDVAEGSAEAPARGVGDERSAGSGGLPSEPGSGAPVGGAGSAGVVAPETPANPRPPEPGAAPALVPRLARRRVEPGRLDSPERRAELQAANDSPVFAPYERGTELERNPHPRLVVETRSQAGMPAPALAVTTFKSKLVDAAWGRSGAQGGISDDQADMVLQALSAWERGHGFLVASDVGVGKSRIGASLILEALGRGKKRIIYSTKNETNLVDVQRELRLVATGKEDGDFPATFILGQDFPKAATRGGRTRTEGLPQPRGPVVYLVHSYNLEPLHESLLEVDPEVWIADEAHEYKNAYAKRGVAWQRMHSHMLDRGHHEIAYLTATPAVTMDEMGYLYGLKEWKPGGFADWIARRLGKAGAEAVGDEKTAAAQTAADTELGERAGIAEHSAGDVVPGKKKPFFREQTDAFSGRITPAETEQVMRELKGLGKFRANDLWRGGVEFEVRPVDLLGQTPAAVAARARYDKAAALCREITTAARKFGYMNEQVKGTGLERALIQSYMKQLLFDLRLPTILDAADQSLRAGKQVVVSVHTVTGDVDAEEGLSEAESETPLNKRLESAVNRINTKEVKKVGTGDEVEYQDLGEIPEALAKRAELLDMLRELPPLKDPVRALEDHFGAKNLAVITGKITPPNRTKQMAEFQSGKRKIALISKAGKIGISLHDVNGRSRHLIVGDYEWSADVFKQELGRVDRTGQRSKPLISLVASNIAGERKFASTIAARMSTLGATSKGAAEATGTDALDQFEATGDLPVAAMKAAIEKLPDDLRQYFTGSKFVEAKQGARGGLVFQAKRRPDDADMRSFLLEMLMFPVEASDKVLNAWVAEREKLMTGEAIAAAEARKTGKRSGRVTRETVLTKGAEPHLAMYEVQNDAGEQRAILQGFVTQHITAIQDARGTDESGYQRPRRYVSFTDTASGELIAGLEVAMAEARRIKAAFGQAERRYLTPADVFSDLSTGDDVKIQGPEGVEWVLHPRRDGRIQIRNATVSKHRNVLSGYAQYEPVGNYLYIKEGETLAGVERFLARFPVDQPKVDAAPGFVPPEPSAARYERLGAILRSPLGIKTKELLRDRLIEAGHDQAEVEALDDRGLANRVFESQVLTPEEESKLLDDFKGEAGFLRLSKRGRARAAAPAELATPNVRDGIRRMFNPPGRTEGAREMANVIRAEKGEERRLNAMAQAALDRVRKGFPKLDTKEGVEFADMMETGQPVDPAREPAAKLIRQLLDDGRTRVQDLGTGRLEHFIADYLPHIWEKPEEARSILSKIMGRRPLQGPKSFLKKRSIPTIAEGIEAGLKPVTNDLLDLVALKLREMNKYVAAQRIMQAARKQGLAKFVRAGKRAQPGYARINDSIATVYGPFTDQGAMSVRGEFYAPEPVARILNNYLSPGLRGNPIFDAYMFVGNTLNAVQLGLSAFHLGFVSLDAMVSQFALGLEQLVAGQVPRAIGNMATFWTAPFTTVLRGSKLRGEYLFPGSRGGKWAELADAVTAGGGSVSMDKFYKNSSVEAFIAAARKGRLGKAALHIIPAAMEFAAKPLMEVFVPRMKMGVFADLAAFELGRLPPDATEDQLRAVMAKVWDSVDNRMGQLVYDNLFWNRTIKDLGMASVRALGWNLGSARELGGGLYDLGHGRFTHRGAYVLALPIVLGLLGAVMMYLYTGHGPESLQDYFEPRTGKKDAEGNDERMVLPSYMKDVIGFARHPIQTLGHKLHPLISYVMDMLTNRDYWENEIRNPRDPMVEQLKQVVDYTATQFTPLGIRNIQEQQRRLQTGAAKFLPFVGVTPANREAVRSKAQNLMHDILSSRGQGGATPEQVELRGHRRDIADSFRAGTMSYQQAADSLVKMGLTTLQVRDALRRMNESPLVTSFKQLTAAEAEQVYAAGTPEEQSLWDPYLARKRSGGRSRPGAPRPPRQGGRPHR